MAYEITDTSNDDYYEFTVRSPSGKFALKVKHYEYGGQILIEGDDVVSIPADSAEAISEAMLRLMSKARKPHYMMKFKDDLEIAFNDFGLKLCESNQATIDTLWSKYQTARNLIDEVRKGLAAGGIK